MSFKVKSFQQLVSDMVAWIIANAPQITDLTPGSVIRSFCEGTGLCLEELYVSAYLGFKRYLDQIPQIVFNFDRKAGVKATAAVQFGRSGTTGTVSAPIGTRVQTVSGLTFLTTAIATITPGNTTSNLVEAEAEEVGTNYNVSASSIIVMVDNIDGIETVTNPNAATGGVNEETDYNYKKRFQAYTEGLGKANIAGLLAGALSVEGITSASVVELFPPVSNINVRLYIDDGSVSGVSTAKVDEVQLVIDGDGTQDSPGYRAAGVNVVVTKPSIVTQNISIDITAIGGLDIDQLQTDINLAITSYINNLGVGNDIIYNEIIAAVMGVYGVSDCDLNTPSGNVTITDTQVGRVGTITINVV